MHPYLYIYIWGKEKDKTGNIYNLQDKLVDDGDYLQQVKWMFVKNFVSHHTTP